MSVLRNIVSSPFRFSVLHLAMVHRMLRGIVSTGMRFFEAVFRFVLKSHEAKTASIDAYQSKDVTHFGYCAYGVFPQLHDNGSSTNQWYYMGSSRDSNRYCDYLKYDVWTLEYDHQTSAHEVLLNKDKPWLYLGQLGSIPDLALIHHGISVMIGSQYVDDTAVVTAIMRQYLNSRNVSTSMQKFLFAKWYPIARGYDDTKHDLYTTDEGCSPGVFKSYTSTATAPEAWTTVKYSFNGYVNESMEKIELDHTGCSAV
jgi:hypothetical protein